MASMIAPNIPMITGSVSKPPKKESLSEVIAGAATIVKAVSPAPFVSTQRNTNAEVC